MLLFTQGWLCILLSLDSMLVLKTMSAAAQTETSQTGAVYNVKGLHNINVFGELVHLIV